MSERILYREGQLLASSDLRDAMERDDRLRALHVRDQHGSWGIAEGLSVSVAPGARAVIVDEGHALDVEGRELLVPAERTVPVPEVGGPERFALVALAERRRRPRPALSACGGEELPRRRERAVLAWRAPAEVAPGTVVLAVARVEGGQVEPPLERRGRRYARRMMRPRIATGSTEGRSSWREWKVAEHGALGLELEVDTRDAAFRATPLYLVTLAGPAFGLAGAATGEWPRGASVLDSGHLGFVAWSRPDAFLFRLAGGAPPFGFPLDAEAARDRGWHLRWVGVEEGKGGA